MNFQNAIKSGFKNWKNHSGRASRSEYWYWILAGILIDIFCEIIDMSLGFNENGYISYLAITVLIIPSVNMSIRRLHDLDFGGWWFALFSTIALASCMLFIYYVIDTDGEISKGILSLLILAVFSYFFFFGFACKRGTKGTNRFGRDPLGNEALEK